MTRQQQIIRTGYIGIGTNVIVAIGKTLVGLASGSMAILLDAVNNITDALSSVITIVGVKLAGRPADDKHPFGYGRIEYFTAVIIASLILVAGSTSFIESIKSIIEPEEQEYSTIGLIIIAVSIVVKTALGLYTKRQGKALNSDSLISSGTECIYDSVVSISTLISAGAFLMFGWSLDSWLAAIISCLIIKAGIEMLVSPVNELLGMRADLELTNSIKSKANTVEGVRGVFDVVLHNYGPDQHLGALHVEVDETLPASELHKITRRIQRIIRNEFGIFVTVGFYAHHQSHTSEAKEEQRIREHVLAIDNVLGMHGFYVNHEEKMLSFDIVYSFKEKHPISLRQQVIEWLQKDYSGFDISIGLDRNYSE